MMIHSDASTLDAAEGRALFQGRAIQCSILEGGIAELRFDLEGESVNKFNRATLEELGEAVARIQADKTVKGLLVTSGKDAFIVGADITEFLESFKVSEDELAASIMQSSRPSRTSTSRPSPPSTASPSAAASSSR
jgi:3-hydroxyacyl-CoA dehydrogenase / enoyl-CoA hydratase / 3-hydroxybutyryl-CoA epimerase / enoyl-CoA isomerase